MSKQQFRKGFLQRSKGGSYIIRIIKIGGRKIALQFQQEFKLKNPEKPIK